MKARFAVVLGTALFLGGCFDGHYDIALNNDGSGTLTMEVVFDKDLSKDILKDKKAKPDKQMMQPSLGKNARSSQRVEDGRVVASQTLAFKTLAEITASDLDIEVQNLGRNLVGVSRSRIRFGTGSNPNGPKEGKPDSFGAGIAAQMFKGHEMRVTMHLPCVVEKAETVKNGDDSYAPKVEKSWFNGSNVEWRVPMSAMLEMAERPHGRDFSVTCWSFKGIPAGHSRTEHATKR